MEQTQDQRLAEQRYFELCQMAAIGGRLQPSLIMEAGEAAGYPMQIEVKMAGQESWPINTLLADAIYNTRISFSQEKGIRAAYLDGTEFVVGPWYEALVAISKWREVIKPNWITWVESDKKPSAAERLDKLIAELSTAYVFDPVELKFLVGEVGWSKDVWMVMPKGIPPSEEKDTALPLDAFEILPLCEHGAKILTDRTIELPHPQESTKYRFAEKSFIKIIEGLNQRAQNLKIPW